MTQAVIGGKNLKFSVTFEQLYELRSADPQSYREFFDIYAEEEKTTADKAILLYIAYLCANLNCSRLSEDEFFTLLDENLTAINDVYNNLFYKKNNFDFCKAFRRKTKSSIKMPNYKLRDIEDYYAFYVINCGIPDSAFWKRDIAFIETVAINKAAVDSFISYETEKANKR